MITNDMRALIEHHSLGYVASVDADGTPNLSPKATMVVLDETRIAFGDLRSPRTMANIAERPTIEINFVDVFSRKGYRFKGSATYAKSGSAEFENLLSHFARWGALTEKLRGIVIVEVTRALALVSPAYDDGATEEDLRASWRETYLSQ